jgi:peptidyl-prolyl cis-trans isomerase B (cyclophilin B)
VSSVRDRQRAAARAKLEREMAERAEAQRLRRNRQVRIGAVFGAVLLLLVVTWVFIANRGSGTTSTPTAAPTSTSCSWNPIVDPSASPAPSLPPGFKNVGTPPVVVPTSGYQVMTVDTNLGTVKVQMDLSKTPCTAASISYLASKKFYDGGDCSALADSLGALVCGDPKGAAGLGGPTYSYANENLPTTRLPYYTVGDVAMYNQDQQDQPSQGTNGAKFFFVYKESNMPAQFTLLGRVIQGWDVVQKVAAGGADAKGKPKTPVTIKTVTVSAPTTTAASEPQYSAPPTSAAPSSAAPAASATPSANPSS